jgi:hypothetical protein
MKVHGTTTDPPLHDDADDEHMLMAEYASGYDGLRYTYNGYLYDRLADAIAYWKLMRSQPSSLDPAAHVCATEPTGPDKAHMLRLLK